MRIVLIALACCALLVPALAAGSASVGRAQVFAWASATKKGAVPPADAAKGAVYCKAAPIKRLYAFIRFQGMRDKVASSATWYFDDKRVYVFPFKWEDGPSGRTAFDIFRQKGTLEEGRYRIEVRSGGRLAGSGAVRLRFGAC